MAPLPKRKLSKARQGKRRAAIKLTVSSVIFCPSCGKPVRPHTVCTNCGTYKGKVYENTIRSKAPASKAKTAKTV